MKIIENDIEYDVWLIEKCYFWHVNNKVHRENGPAVESIDKRYKAWCKYGRFHREDGPAVIYLVDSKEMKEYYLNGDCYSGIASDEEWLIKNIIE